jgi:hypothetical protein
MGKVVCLKAGGEMKERIIIENRTKMPIDDAMVYVMHVISQGRVSESKLGKQYCYVTTWKDGTIVYSEKNKASDRFVVSQEAKK